MPWSNAWGSDCAAKGTGQISKVFGLSWKDALEQGLVYNLVDDTPELNRPMSELGAEHGGLKKCETMLSFLAVVSTAER